MNSNVHDSYIGNMQEFCFNGGWFKPIRVAFLFYNTNISVRIFVFQQSTIGYRLSVSCIVNVFLYKMFDSKFVFFF